MDKKIVPYNEPVRNMIVVFCMVVVVLALLVLNDFKMGKKIEALEGSASSVSREAVSFAVEVSSEIFLRKFDTTKITIDNSFKAIIAKHNQMAAVVEKLIPLIPVDAPADGDDSGKDKPQ